MESQVKHTQVFKYKCSGRKWVELETCLEDILTFKKKTF